MNKLITRVKALRAELAERESALAFVQRNLPAELVEAVEEYSVRKDDCCLRIQGNLEQLKELIQIFPMRTTQQYRATHTGNPVSREETQSLRVTEAALPVHAAWQTDSDLIGSGVNWMTTVEGINLRVQVIGALSAETRAWLWNGLTPTCNVKGITLWTAPLATPEMLPSLPEGQAPQATLDAVVEYLNTQVAEHGARCRGFAPAPILEYLARAHFKLPLEVSQHRSTWTGSIPDRAFNVSLKDPKGFWWHELGKVRQVYRQGSLDDTLWCDLAPLCASLI